MHNVVLEFENPSLPKHLQKQDYIHGFNLYSFLFLEMYALYKKRRLAFLFIPLLQFIFSFILNIGLSVVMVKPEVGAYSSVVYGVIYFLLFLFARLITSMISEKIYMARLIKKGYKLVSFSRKNDTKDVDLTLENLKDYYKID